MNLVRELLTNTQSTASACFVLALVIALGSMIGSVRVRGIRLGVAGVLFAGLAFGHFHFTLDHNVLEFAREFGLILFVYTLGLAVGPGFVNAFRADGLRLNLLALTVVLVGVGVTLLIWRVGGVPMPVAAGLYSGATTNTPSLAASTQALADHPPEGYGPHEAERLPGVGYAIAYPFGVIGIILSMIVLRRVAGVDPQAEAQRLEAAAKLAVPHIDRVSIRVANTNLRGLSLQDIPGLAESGAVVSRLQRGKEVMLARGDFRLELDDVLLVVGPTAAVRQLILIIGEQTDQDLTLVPGSLTARWLMVTKRQVVGKRSTELERFLDHRVQITRVRRAEIELPPTPSLIIQMGDQVRVVGSNEDVTAAAHWFGDSPKQLERPELIPLFIGIGLGVLLGSIPIAFPGLPAAVKLGLAGGPLIVALIVSQFARVGPLIWYLPSAGNMMIRELGISLFLAAVGLKSGEKYLATVLEGDGIYWMMISPLITALPLLLVGIFALKVLRIGIVPILGLTAGSMTDPPALAFAHGQANSDLPSVAYASVYPFSMILRILTAQIMVLALV